jgi:hypothetical protein
MKSAAIPTTVRRWVADRWRLQGAAVCCIAMAGFVAAGAMAGSASAARSPHLTRIERPRVEQVVGNGKVRVVLRSRANLRALRVLVDGHGVKRFLHRSARGYRGVLRLGRGLRYGVNELIVATRRSADFDSVRFIVARRAPKLLTVRNLRVGGRESPVRVVAGAKPHTTLQAWLNGRRVDHAFHGNGRAYVGRLGANDGVRPGRNRLVVLTHRTHRSGRSAHYDMERTTFRSRRGRVIAGAGRDRVLSAGGFITLRGTTSGGRSRASGAPTVKHRWKIVSRPPGPAPILNNANSATPEFFPRAPGVYRIRTTVRTANGSSSTDTVTDVVREDVPPIGWRLDTTDDSGTIMLNGEPVAKTSWPCGAACPSPYVSYAVFDRQTLELVESDARLGDAGGMTFLANKATALSKAIGKTYVMVVNLSGSSAELPDGKRLLATLGAPKVDRAPLPRPVSIVGVPGSPAGSAFVSDNFLHCTVNLTNCPTPLSQQHLANMSGYLRLNPADVGRFEFVFADQLEFNTDASTAPSQITMKVGDATTYAHATPTDGSAGFFLVMLNSHTLALDRTDFYTTNKPDRSENVSEEVRMADVLDYASSAKSRRGELLVMLQAFGNPKGLDGAWLRAAAAIERLGGNAQVFARLNQGNALEPNQGRYAFVGRAAMDTAGAESSQSLTGRAGDGKLKGMIARTRDAQYAPLLADPGGTVNVDLVKTVNRPSPANGGFPEWKTSGEAKAADFLGRSNVIGVCASDPQTPCDVRRAYYESNVGWGTILTQLGDSGKTACAIPNPDFSETECNAARTEFQTEIGQRNIVEDYFGPTGLKAAVVGGGAGLQALTDVGQVSEQIRSGLPSFPANNATSHVLNLITNLIKIGSLSALVCPPCGPVASAVGGATGIAAYLTQDDGSPDVIGPAVTKASSSLGTELVKRYKLVASNLTAQAQIIMSDYTKMTDVATRARNDSKWKLNLSARTDDMFTQANRQVAYQALVPVAYPEIYDLGPPPEPPKPFDDARQWFCYGGAFAYDKHLFQKTGGDAQLKYKMTGPSYPAEYPRVPALPAGQEHVMAVGGHHTVLSLHSAFVPAPPDSLTATMFRDPNSLPTGTGAGLYKIELYSPRYFHLFQPVLQQFAGGFQYCSTMPNPPGNAG